MSLDISVTNPKTGASLEMNWLRNPYGLCQWAEDNYLYITRKEPRKSLWYVINHWNYDKSPRVNRKLFLKVVQQYGEIILALKQGYFFFTAQGLAQFVLPHLDIEVEAKGKGVSLILDKPQIMATGLLMDYFAHPCFHLSDKYRPDAHTLSHYQDWYRELIAFAELLQEPDTKFYCSN